MTEVHWAKEETHDPSRQMNLLGKANQIACVVAGKQDVLGMFLTGSTARGPVMTSSDLDLHVVTAQAVPLLPEWSFAENIVINVHHVNSAILERTWRSISDPAKLARWLHRTLWADEMYGFQTLSCAPNTAWPDKIHAIVNARKDPQTIDCVANLFVRDCRHLLRRAGIGLATGAVADAHQLLRWGIQKLLISALVRRGWMIRGSKHQLEIALAFLPDAIIARILETLFDVVALRNLTPKDAATIATLRLRYRQDLLAALNILEPSQQTSDVRSIVDFQLRHNAGAFDYYAPLIEAGMYRGAVNHIRAISGFSRIPKWFLPLVGRPVTWPISEFLESSAVAPQLQSQWLEITALNTSASTVGWLLNSVESLVDIL